MKNKIPKNAHATTIRSVFACAGLIPIVASAFGFCNHAYPAAKIIPTKSTTKAIHHIPNALGEILLHLFCIGVLIVGACAGVAVFWTGAD
jgi:hypothetical protein